MVQENIERRNIEYRFKTNGFELYLYNPIWVKPVSDEKIKKCFEEKKFNGEGCSVHPNTSYIERWNGCNDEHTAKQRRIKVKVKKKIK